MCHAMRTRLVRERSRSRRRGRESQIPTRYLSRGDWSRPAGQLPRRSLPPRRPPRSATRLTVFEHGSTRESNRKTPPPGFAWWRSPQWRHVQDAAVLPQPVDAAFNAKRRDVAFDAFRVVADLLDDPVGPRRVETEHLAEAVTRADEPAHVRVVAVERPFDRHRSQPELLGVDHRIHRPPHDLEPALIVRHDAWSVRSSGN